MDQPSQSSDAERKLAKQKSKPHDPACLLHWQNARQFRSEAAVGRLQGLKNLAKDQLCQENCDTSHAQENEEKELWHLLAQITGISEVEAARLQNEAKQIVDAQHCNDDGSLNPSMLGPTSNHLKHSEEEIEPSSELQKHLQPDVRGYSFVQHHWNSLV